ncbi:MAG: class I SAM-dependent methyltransferase [Patescibacteria group bacterium]
MKNLKVPGKVRPITSCQACQSKNLYKFINFGPMPKPNIYMTREEALEQGLQTFQLDASLCTDCGLVQLGEIVPSEELFAENYAYRTPEAMRPDFKESAEETASLAGIKKGAKVLEIGSNIGICLDEYRKMGMKVLGVDPATIYAKQANKSGIETIIEPFTPSLADNIVREKGKMDVVTAANVLQHIPDLVGTIEGIRKVLAPNGVFSLEFPYLGDILNNTDFDTFYAEHYYYLSLAPLQKIFESMGMTMVHAKKLPQIHNGSMRIFVKHGRGSTNMSRDLWLMIKDEEDSGFLNPKKFSDFKSRVDNIVHQINMHLYVAKARGEHVVAHGCSAKFVTLTNYMHIGEDVISYVADNTDVKQGKVTPGMGIPVVSEEKLMNDAPDIIFNGIRNFYNYNKEKYDKIKKKNPKTKILMPIPEVYYL